MSMMSPGESVTMSVVEHAPVDAPNEVDLTDVRWRTAPAINTGKVNLQATIQ